VEATRRETGPGAATGLRRLSFRLRRLAFRGAELARRVRSARIRSLQGRPEVLDVRNWAIWELPRWLVAFVGVIVLADAVFLAVAGSRLHIRAHDLELFAALLLCAIATVEMTRRIGENWGFVKDVHAIWELPVAMLLPLAYAPVLPIVRFTFAQWRILRVHTYRRVFSAAAIGLAYVVAGLVFHTLIRVSHLASANPDGHALTWMIFVAIGAVVSWIVNQALVLTAIKGSNPAMKLREEQFAREPIYNDLTEFCVEVLVTFCLAYTVVAAAFAFPFVSLLQRSLRHTRLLRDSQVDSKTGLLNAATWERQASAEVARAVRTRTALAVAMLDIDRFKAINDTYGHLAGDQVIKEIALTLTTLLRDYDLAGRFGGEEFSLLLPHTRAVDALRIAERVRANVADLRINAPGAMGEERVRVTVSIGVAALDSGSERQLGELVAAADAALYRAKAGGRDQVQMISTTRGLSAVSSDGLTSGTQRDAPSVFQRLPSP
jgi:diguanylate cyclase (GGDEF)-like protein